jgi:putative protease
MHGVTRQEVAMAEEREIGTITHYFGKIKVAAIKLTAPLAVGNTIHIKGHTTDVTEKIATMQIEHNQVAQANAGESVGINVTDHVRVGDKVFLVT